MTMLQVGDKVVFTCDKAKAGQVVRLYGEVESVGLCRLTIRTSDGQLHVREPEHVAVFRVLPPNWETLYSSVCTVHQQSEAIGHKLPKRTKPFTCAMEEEEELAPA